MPRTITSTDLTVFNALKAVQVYDFKQHHRVCHRPRRVAVAADLPYDTVRRSLAKLHGLGLIDKVSPEDEFIGRDLFYSPNWSMDSSDRDRTPSGWLTEWDYQMSIWPNEFLPGAGDRLRRADERAAERRFHGGR
jgi:hypothetical protein